MFSLLLLLHMAMKPNMTGVLVSTLFLFQLLVIAAISMSLCNGNSYHVGCLESEREVLLRFKQDLQDPSNRLASWIGDGDCCLWAGVICDNVTGHILELNLRNPFNYYVQPDQFEANPRSMLVGKFMKDKKEEQNESRRLNYKQPFMHHSHVQPFLVRLTTMNEVEAVTTEMTTVVGTRKQIEND
ncbi:uncharacterized protein LOC102625061 isoform X3 [Citrus sinensis]|uniref:uncharacterized protein LOC102625061 isoform X3 n=1 Tax=Citrus sinensis TaxID=2711 RepID=UPI000D62C464|nr:uncharacterized protein LOC102625061 isoform X3 [Citrus sinensis]